MKENDKVEAYKQLGHRIFPAELLKRFNLLIDSEGLGEMAEERRKHPTLPYAMVCALYWDESSEMIEACAGKHGISIEDALKAFCIAASALGLDMTED